jgi:hypothetical protein
MAARTNSNLTKQPNQHQTRKDKELQKEKRKKDCPNKTKPKPPKTKLKNLPEKNSKPTIKITYPNKRIPPTPHPNTKTNHTK